MPNNTRKDLLLEIRLSNEENYEIVKPFSEGPFIVGRHSDKKKDPLNALLIKDNYISRQHCKIFPDDDTGQWLIEDLGSSNGTKVDGMPLGTFPVPLRVGSKIRIGTTIMRMDFDGVERAEKSIEWDATIVRSKKRKGTAESIIIDQPLQKRMESATIVGRSEPLSKPSPAPQTQIVAPIQQEPQQESQQESQQKPKQKSLRSMFKQGLFAHLLDSNFVEKNQLQKYCDEAAVTGQTFFRLLAEDDSIKFLEEIYQLVSDDYQLTYIKDEEHLNEQVIENDWFSFENAEHMGAVALTSEDEDHFRYATIDPFDLVTHDWIQRSAHSKSVEKVLIHPSTFLSVIQRRKNRPDISSEEEIGVAIDISTEASYQIREQIDSAEVPQMVNYFLFSAHRNKASDIHIEPTEEQMLVRNRVDGILHQDIVLPMPFHPEVASRIKIMSGMDVAEKRRPQDGRIESIIQGNPIDIRVSSYPTVYGEKIVMRLLDKNALRPSTETLGLLDRDLRLLKDKINAPYGLLMISGPTGSGKTTTLYSCLGSIDKDAKNVLTVEDPVEYRLKGVHQMQVNEKIGLTFASGLRTILRQDPDVVMVGECRDTETAAMAIQASLTGHIVFSTIHTNDSVGVVTRLLDMGIEPFLVATSLSIAIAQRLVRRICKHCKTTLSGEVILSRLHDDGISDERLDHLGVEIDPDLDYAHGAGCEHCRDTGYTGRCAVFEIFEMTNEARNLIMRDDFNADKLRDYSRKQGMTTLISHGLKLVEEEITTFEEAIRVLGEQG